MKAKLHKMVSGYILSLNGDIDDPYAIVNEELAKDHKWHRLSLKNCQAIENGYDLYELAIERFGNSSHHANNRCSFREGFQKALEILGDKKFSEEDVNGFIDYVIREKHKQEGVGTGLSNKELTSANIGVYRVFQEKDIREIYWKEYIQSLHQTEWDVEIVTENICGRCYSNNTNECWSTKECSDGKYDYPKPLLDADGCLILKRIWKEN